MQTHITIPKQGHANVSVSSRGEFSIVWKGIYFG